MVSRIVALVALLLSVAVGLALAERPATAAAKRSVVPRHQVPIPKPKPTLKPKPAPTFTAPPAAKPASLVEIPLPRPKPALTQREREKGVAASLLFAAKKLASVGRPEVFGYYSHGCLQGGLELPPIGPHWQIMRPSRNRNWGHPELIRFLKRISAAVAKATGWPGILIGDMAQPRGGPLPSGHTSHQVGLDVDIWYKPMPDRILTEKERDEMPPTFMIAENGLEVNKNWTPADAAFVRTIAEQPEVERVLLNAAVKKKMCELEGKHHYAWMAKLRPWYFHTSHIHVRLKCPAHSPHCRHQPPVPKGDGCAKKNLAFWFSKKVLNVKPETPSQKLENPITMARLPSACRRVLNAPVKKTDLAAEEK
jgi:penicillin-insensitive murein endopeptidase